MSKILLNYISSLIFYGFSKNSLLWPTKLTDWPSNVPCIPCPTICTLSPFLLHKSFFFREVFQGHFRPVSQYGHHGHFELENSFLWGAVLCTAGCLAAFIASIHQIPIALPGVTTKKCLSPLPSVFWGAKSPPVENKEAVSTKNYWVQNVNSAKVKKSHSYSLFQTAGHGSLVNCEINSTGCK